MTAGEHAKYLRTRTEESVNKQLASMLPELGPVEREKFTVKEYLQRYVNKN